MFFNEGKKLTRSLREKKMFSCFAGYHYVDTLKKLTSQELASLVDLNLTPRVFLRVLRFSSLVSQLHLAVRRYPR